MCGTLQKRGYWNTAFKSRFFVLTQRGDLDYYRTQQDAEAGVCRLGTIAVALPDGIPEDLSRTLETRVRATSASSDAEGRFLMELEVRSIAAVDYASSPAPRSGWRLPSFPGRPAARTYVLAAPSAVTR
eukprot:CAMPEP_0113681192 /NCGR_PEP_ID=MMETSP0038_2-20120614/11828_1 /TAXON_ID=2898 /ORGANISM="Cryptomonas paramecium" /LENGTH=128 /DNA_ID=CAMNT_0000599837 /DNA_START=219 /DNA_END=601 /DNA_ORIENTATION=+ /assembly_acc=CAM_ASM_000170